MPVMRFRGRDFPIRTRTLVLVVLSVLLASVGLTGRIISMREFREDDAARRSAPAAEPGPPSAYAEAVRAAALAGLDAARRKDPANDAFYFADGVWQTGKPLCFRCNVGPGVVAAALGSLRNDPDLVAVAEQTIDPPLSKHRSENGALGIPAQGEDGPDIQTMSFAGQLGLSLYALRDDLDPARMQTWTEALRGATEFLISNGNYAWYTNGNITLGNAMVAALTWKLTGDARYQAVYANALAFAQRPPAAQWPGRGLVLTKNPTLADGSDGAGYLTEVGGGSPGFDADYAQVQADEAAVIALVTQDPAAIRLANLLVNQLLPRVDRTTWLLDTSGGSRHPESRRTVPFTTSALAVLAANGRADLAPLVPSQALQSVKYLVDDRGDGAYTMWGTRLAPLLIAVR